MNEVILQLLIKLFTHLNLLLHYFTFPGNTGLFWHGVLDEKKFGTPELTMEVVNWKSTFMMDDGTADILGNIAKTYKEAIALDLRRLKRSSVI